MRNLGWKQWSQRIGAILIVGGLILGPGSMVAQAGEEDSDHNRKNPLDRILYKLDKILDAVKDGGKEGNHTLRWDTNHLSASRFTVLADFGGKAVRDNNTGLVWEQAPDTTPRTWHQATAHCVNKNVGGTVGWRLPSVVELKSVQNPALPAPFVPAGVFSNIQSSIYWSATSINENSAWDVLFFVGIRDTPPLKEAAGQVWCVRGPMQESVY